MATNDGFKKYVEAGAVLAQITRARAEEIVRDLVNAGQVQGGQAQAWVDDLVERSRKASEDLMALVRTEVTAQLSALGLDPQDLAKQVADILKQSANAGRGAVQKAAGRAKKGTAKKAAATKKAAAKKAAAKKAAARRPSAGKAAAGKKAAGKATATKKKAT